MINMTEYSMQTTPQTTGMAISVLAGLAAGALAIPLGLLAVPLLMYGVQQSQSRGGASAFAAQTDHIVHIYPIDSDKQTISPVFSRAPYFAIVVDGELQKIVANPYKDYPGAASRYIVSYLAQFHPHDVVVRDIGRNAEIMLRGLGINVRRI